MAHYQITCITRDRNDRDRRIDALGSPSLGVRLIDTYIAWHNAGHRFYVMVGTSKVYLRKLQHPVTKRWFFSTEPDGRFDNNLYALPECPL